MKMGHCRCCVLLSGGLTDSAFTIDCDFPSHLNELLSNFEYSVFLGNVMPMVSYPFRPLLSSFSPRKTDFHPSQEMFGQSSPLQVCVSLYNITLLFLLSLELCYPLAQQTVNDFALFFHSYNNKVKFNVSFHYIYLF
jgi:hypothetical protein